MLEKGGAEAPLRAPILGGLKVFIQRSGKTFWSGYQTVVVVVCFTSLRSTVRGMEEGARPMAKHGFSEGKWGTKGRSGPFADQYWKETNRATLNCANTLTHTHTLHSFLSSYSPLYSFVFSFPSFAGPDQSLLMERFCAKT